LPTPPLPLMASFMDYPFYSIDQVVARSMVMV
jgi:hypothetical protein